MKMPHLIKPMLSVLVDEPFDRKGWIFENKWDGYRAIAEISSGKVLLYSRNKLSFNETYPEIVSALKKLGLDSAIFDGELIVVDHEHKQSFQLMQNYQTLKEGKVLYCIFDLLYLNGLDLRSLSLTARKNALKTLLAGLRNQPLKYTQDVKTKGVAFFKKAEKLHLEGIMGKRADSPYVMARSSDWVKIKTHLRQEVVIGGFTPPEGARKEFGALLVGVYKNSKLQFAGKVGGGFTEQSLVEVSRRLKPLVQKHSPFATGAAALPKATFVKPKLVCEVSFAEWTQDKKMRQPIFKGMRLDKSARQVKREYPSHV